MNTPKFIEVETVTDMKVTINVSNIIAIHPNEDTTIAVITNIETVDNTIWNIKTPYEEIKAMLEAILEGLNA